MIRRKITVLQHGTASPLQPGMPYQADLDRHLAPEGVREALERRCALGDPRFDLVLFSPANCCVETMMNVSKTGSCMIIPLNELCHEDGDTRSGRAFAKMRAALGNASYGEYDKLDEYGMLQSRSERAWGRCTAQIQQCDAKQALVVTSNPFASAIGHVASRGASESWAGTLKDAVFTGAQGYTLTFDDGELADVELHR